jgi:hypothetical protein
MPHLGAPSATCDMAMGLSAKKRKDGYGSQKARWSSIPTTRDPVQARETEERIGSLHMSEQPSRISTLTEKNVDIEVKSKVSECNGQHFAKGDGT